MKYVGSVYTVNVPFFSIILLSVVMFEVDIVTYGIGWSCIQPLLATSIHYPYLTILGSFLIKK